MSYSGMSPKVNRLRLQPRSSDPVNPAEGDLQYADGTARAEGLYIYKNGSWQNVVDATGNVNTLVFNPQSSDPSVPTTGMIFNSDGTSREAGLWQWNGTDWEQISRLRMQLFAHSTVAPVKIKCASTNNISITASPLFNGQNNAAWDSVTVATGDLVLLKNQATASENGVYVVPATSGTLVRATQYDSVSELNKAVVVTTAGSTQKYKKFVQTETIVTVGVDSQTWVDDAAATRPSFNFVVPQDVNEILVQILGGGAGGGGGGRSTPGNGGGSGGGGGAGVLPNNTKLSVTPGETLTVIIGTGGYGGNFSPIVGTREDGGVGSDSLIKRSTTTLITAYGANQSGEGGDYSGSTAVGGVGGTGLVSVKTLQSSGGNGGDSDYGGPSATNGSAGEDTFYASGGAGGLKSDTTCGGGGGGGAGLGAGGAGVFRADGQAGGYGAGGGGGCSDVTGALYNGGNGGNGLVKIIW